LKFKHGTLKKHVVNNVPYQCDNDFGPSSVFSPYYTYSRIITIVELVEDSVESVKDQAKPIVSSISIL